MKLEERLEKMVNKPFMYNATEYKILSFKVFSEEVTLVTDKGWKTFPITKVNAELEKFLPIEVENTMPVLLTVFENGNKKSLRDIILDNIKKIQEDPKYIGQAKALNEQIKTMLAMAKLELESVKLKREVGL